MEQIIDIPKHIYENIKDLDSVSLGRCNYKGIIMSALKAIKCGSTQEDYCKTCKYRAEVITSPYCRHCYMQPKNYEYDEESEE